MITDRLPRSQALADAFRKSDRMTSIALPEDDRLIALAKDIEQAMLSEQRAVVSRACHEFLATAAEFYGVPKPAVRGLASQPSACMRVVGVPSFLETMILGRTLPVFGCGRRSGSKSLRSARSSAPFATSFAIN